VLAAIARLEDELSLRGVTAAGSLAARLHALARWVSHDRVARVTVVGRRGAGKSSLLNAIANEPLAKTGAVEDTTGEPRMFELALDGTAVQWIDTGGLRAGGAAEHRADMLCEVLAKTYSSSRTRRARPTRRSTQTWPTCDERSTRHGRFTSEFPR